MAADLFVVPSVTFRLLFVLIILAHDRRRILHVAVTKHPTAAWTAQQLRNTLSEHDATISPPRSRFGLCQRGDHYRRHEHASTNSPAITVAERLRGTRHRSIRRECLDHVIVVNAAGLRRVLTAYVTYYMQSRRHLGLEKDAPISRPVMQAAVGRIVVTRHVGGLHHRYDRAA
jgi:hypothetical protein